MSFQDVIGHRRILDLLARSVARDSLPPSLIFAGPSGVGKRLTANALAQALNCLEPRSWPLVSEAGAAQASPFEQVASARDACGRCAACAKIARGVHPDVLVLEPGDNGSIKIEQAREVVDRSAYRPFEGKRRVVIIDEADALMPGAQHSLLKTLEEPPSLSVFVLVTARPDVLLATVRSRCPRLDFRPLSPAALAEALVTRGRTKTDALAIAASADGSLGRALEASGDAFVEAREIAQRVLTEAASSPEPRRRIEAAKTLLAQTSGSGASDREQLTVHLRAMASLLRDVELLSAHSDSATLANPDLGPALERLVPAYQGERGIRAFGAVDRALVALERNASSKIVADWLVLEL
jgi:DNA polymerase-3 subunit delta'